MLEPVIVKGSVEQKGGLRREPKATQEPSTPPDSRCFSQVVSLAFAPHTSATACPKQCLHGAGRLLWCQLEDAPRSHQSSWWRRWGKTDNAADHCALQTARVETAAFYLRHVLLSSELVQASLWGIGFICYQVPRDFKYNFMPQWAAAMTPTVSTRAFLCFVLFCPFLFLLYWNPIWGTRLKPPRSLGPE